MVLRIILFELKPDVSDYDSRVLLAMINSAVKSVPGLIGFHVGRRMGADGAYTIGLPAGGEWPEFGYAAVFQFEDAKALQSYFLHPAHHDLRSRFAAVVSAATTADYQM